MPMGSLCCFVNIFLFTGLIWTAVKPGFLQAVPIPVCNHNSAAFRKRLLLEFRYLLFSSLRPENLYSPSGCAVKAGLEGSFCQWSSHLINLNWSHSSVNSLELKMWTWHFYQLRFIGFKNMYHFPCTWKRRKGLNCVILTKCGKLMECNW